MVKYRCYFCLNFSIAFGQVEFEIDLNKIKRMSTSGKIYDWIKAFLINKYQTVIVNSIYQSTSCRVLSGIPQGSVLGRHILIILINDIGINIKHSNFKSFADVSKIFADISNVRDITHLQTDLNSIYDWPKTSNMQFNANKFNKVLRYGNGGSLSPVLTKYLVI